MVHHLHRTTLLPHHPTRPLSTLDLFLNPTQSLLLNQSPSPSTISQYTNRTPSNTLSLNTSSRSTSPIPSNTQNLILNPSLTIPMLPHHLRMSLFMNQLTLNQPITSRRITRSTQSQAPSRTTHLNKNHTTHLKNHTTHLSKSPTIHLSQNHTTL